MFRSNEVDLQWNSACSSSARNGKLNSERHANDNLWRGSGTAWKVFHIVGLLGEETGNNGNNVGCPWRTCKTTRSNGAGRERQTSGIPKEFFAYTITENRGFHNQMSTSCKSNNVACVPCYYCAINETSWQSEQTELLSWRGVRRHAAMLTAIPSNTCCDVTMLLMYQITS